MGLTLIDAGVLIGFLDSDDAHHAGARRQLDAAHRRGDALAIPASAFAEALVAPSGAGESAVQAVCDFVDRLPLAVRELDAGIAVVAADVRARWGQKLRLPDALVIATAIRLGVEVLVTTDRRWPPAGDLGCHGKMMVL